MPGGPGDFGGVQPPRPLVAQFDKDGDKRLNASERKAAREFVAAQPAGGFGGPGFGPPGGRGFGGGTETPTGPSPRFDAATAKTYPASVPFYDLATLRTLRFDFYPKSASRSRSITTRASGKSILRSVST